MAEQPALDELLAAMVRPIYFVISGQSSGDPSKARAHLRDHILYMIELERRGVLFAAGPFVRPDGTPTGDGMSVLRAVDEAEALTLAEADPMVKAGCRTVSVQRWVVNEGSVSVNVRLSDGSGRPA